MYISVDFGGTNTRVAGCQDLDNPIFVTKPLTRRNSDDYESDIAFIVSAARQIGGDTIKALGIGLAGEQDSTKIHMIDAKNNPHWNGKPFAKDLVRQLGCQIFVDSDSAAAALGEAFYGATKTDFVYLIWGTGVGGVWVACDSSGKAKTTALGWSKYFSAWEDDCGGGELEQIYQKPPEQLTDVEWTKVFAIFTRHLQSFVNTIQPKAIVFGGGLSVRHRDALEALSKTLKVSCKVTEFDGQSGLYGGFALIKQSV